MLSRAGDSRRSPPSPRPRPYPIPSQQSRLSASVRLRSGRRPCRSFLLTEDLEIGEVLSTQADEFGERERSRVCVLARLPIGNEQRQQLGAEKADLSRCTR